MSVGLWPGRWKHLERAVAQLDRVAVVQHARHVGPGAPGPERPRHRLQRAHHVLRDPVAQHHVARERRRRPRPPRSSAPRTARRRRSPPPPLRSATATSDTSPRWSMCWWVRITSSMSSSEWPRPRDPAVQLVERGAGVGPGVHQRQRLVLDQVDVHPADGERGRDRESVHARLGGRGEGVFAHARISASTSSRFSSMCSRETSDSRFRRSSGSVLDGPHVEVPVLVVHRHAVQLGDLARRRSAP